MGKVKFSSRKRSSQEEVMDKIDLSGSEMKKVLEDLGRVNNWFGGTNTNLIAISSLLKKVPIKSEVIIVDIGCGDGRMLRKLADFGVKKGYVFKLLGLDFNPNIIEYAESKSTDYKNIYYKTLDIFSEEFGKVDFDIALCTLILHHFSNKDIAKIVRNLMLKAKIGVVINDLQRNRWSFHFFKVLRNFILRNPIARYDGLVSIARGFTKREFISISKAIEKELPFDISVNITRKWAFRFLWMLKKGTLNAIN